MSIRARVALDVLDVLVVVGALLVLYGVYRVSVEAAIILAGVCLLALGLRKPS